MANLATFLSLIAHGDANYADNFLVREGPPFVSSASTTEGRLMGFLFYSDDADPDWEPLRHLAKDQLFCRKWSRGCWHGFGQLPQSPLLPALYVSAVDLIRGKSVADACRTALASFVDRPLAQQPAAKPIGRGTYLIQDPANSGSVVCEGIRRKASPMWPSAPALWVKRYSTGKSE